MPMRLTIALAGAIFLTSTLLVTPVQARSQISLRPNQVTALALLEAIGSGREAPLGKVDANRFVSHDPALPHRIESLKRDWIHAKGGAVDVVRIFSDNDYVFAHSIYDNPQKVIGFDIFRFDQGKIIEHWRKTEARPRNEQEAYERISGPGVSDQSDYVDDNKAVVARFVNQVLIARGGNADEFVDWASLVEHAPARGLAAIIANTNLNYEKAEMVLGEGDFILVIGKGQAEDFFDLFRVKGGKIVEHW